jgi:hypothetical protein
VDGAPKAADTPLKVDEMARRWPFRPGSEQNALTMGLQPNSFTTAPADPGSRVVHVIPTALGRGAQVFARAPVDQDRYVARFALPVIADRWDALCTLMTSPREMHLPGGDAREPKRLL